MENYDTIEYRGFNINVIQDDLNESPREWDNLGTMTCFHRSYILGDSHSYSDPEDVLLSILSDYYDYEWLEDKPINDLFALFEKYYIVLPLFLYDHGGITMSTSAFSCPWDSGQVGIIYVSLETVRKEYGVKRVSKKLRNKIVNCLIGEVETYDQHLTGQVFGYTIEPTSQNKNITCDDSCFGYYGDEGIKDMIAEAKSSIKYAIKEYKTKSFQNHVVRLQTVLFMNSCWAD